MDKENVHLCTMEFFSHKEDKVMAFAGKFVLVDIIILSGLNQSHHEI